MVAPTEFSTVLEQFANAPVEVSSFPHALLQEAARQERLRRGTADWHWKAESHQRGSLKIGIVFFGQRFVGQAVVERARTLTGKNNAPDVFSTSGFTETFQSHGPGLTTEDYVLLELMATRAVYEQALGSDTQYTAPDVVLVATSLPIVPNIQLQIAAVLGVTNPDAVLHLHSLACDSTGYGFHGILHGKYDEQLLRAYPDKLGPLKVAIISLEDGFRAIGDMQSTGAGAGDPSSAMLFSSAATALVFEYKPGEPSAGSFTPIVARQVAVEKGADCLRFKDTTKGWPEEIREKVIRAPYLTQPDTGVVEMGYRTAGFFLKHAVPLAEAVLEDFRVWLSTEMKRELLLHEAAAAIEVAVIHHPSRVIFDAIGERLSPLGIDASKVVWRITEGNAPATTMTTALGRELQYRDLTNKYVLFLTFGAGGSFTCQIVRVNETV